MHNNSTLNTFLFYKTSKGNIFWDKLIRSVILDSLIEFKHIIPLNLNILKKDKIVCVLLINETM
jgi:hypothetical protein